MSLKRSLSARAREKGNSHYKEASHEGLAPTIKEERLKTANKLYTEALNYGRGIDDVEASAAKNIAVSTWNIAKMQTDMKKILFYFKDAIEHFCMAIKCGAMKGDDWMHHIKLQYRSCLDDAIDSLAESSYISRCDKVAFFTRCMTNDLYRIDMHQELATLTFHRGVSALDEGDYKEALYSFKECYTPVELMKQAITRDDILLEARVLEDDLILHTASAEALQAIAIGDSLLNNVLKNEEELNMTMVYEVMDWFRQAIVLSKGVEIEREAVAYSRLGRVFNEVLKMKYKAKDFFQRSIQLAFTLQPRNFSTESWFRCATETVEKIQQESLHAREAKARKEREKYLDELAEEMKQISKNIPHTSEDHYKFVIFIYATFPPTNKAHKHPDVEKLKKMSQAEMKKVVQKAIIHYHPDKVDIEVNGMKKKVLMEEITKEFTRLYEGYKGM